MFSSKSSIVAMEISQTEVKVISFKKGEIGQWASAPIPDGAVKEGTIHEPGTVALIIDTLFDSNQLKRDHVIISISGFPFAYRTIGMPSGLTDKGGEAITRAARKEMSLSETDMHLLWQPIENSSNANESNYFVIGVPKNSLAPVQETLTRAHIKPYLMDIKPLALARAASVSDTIIISLEKNYVDIVLIAGGYIRVIHSLNPRITPLDSVGLVNDVADGLNIALKSLNRDFPQNNLSPETPIMLTGELSTDNQFLKFLPEFTGHPVTTLKAPLALPADAPQDALASTVGLIPVGLGNRISGSLYHDIRFNLFSVFKVRKAPPRFRLAYAALGASVVLMSLMVFKSYDLKVLALDNVSNLQKEAVKVNKTLIDLNKTSKDGTGAIKTGADKLQALNDELNAIRSEHKKIQALKRDYAELILTITSSLPQDGMISKIDGSPDIIRIEGFCKTGMDALGFVETLEKNSRFSLARIDEIAPIIDSDNISFKATLVE